MDIISTYQQVGSYRAAAVICGTTPKTVKRVITRALAGGAAAPRKARVRNYASVAELVAAKIKSTNGRISAKRLLPAARAEGFTGSARNFRRLVAAAKVEWRREDHRGRRPAVWAPGEYLVIDWGELGGVKVFCAVLAWSRMRFVRFAPDEQSVTTLGMLAECFEVLGGVPVKVLADRMGCLKGGVVANVVVPTPDYVAFAGHYGFTPDFCNAADPASKGIVENLVGYGKSDLLVPLLADQPDVGSPAGLAAANLTAAAWCAEVNAAVHSQIVAVPAERLLVEAPLLGALPSLRATIGAPPVVRKVDKLSCVRFASARYSVPTAWVGTRVHLVNHGGRLQVIVPATGQVIADHDLVAPGETSILDAHYGGPRPAPSRKVAPRSVAEREFCALGDVAATFITGAAASGNTRLGGELVELNALAAAHGQIVFLAALGRAVAFRRWRAADVRSILAAGTGTPDPAATGGALVIDLPVAPGRSLAQYAPTTTASAASS